VKASSLPSDSASVHKGDQTQRDVSSLLSFSRVRAIRKKKKSSWTSNGSFSFSDLHLLRSPVALLATAWSVHGNRLLAPDLPISGGAYVVRPSEEKGWCSRSRYPSAVCVHVRSEWTAFLRSIKKVYNSMARALPSSNRLNGRQTIFLREPGACTWRREITILVQPTYIVLLLASIPVRPILHFYGGVKRQECVIYEQ